MAVAHYLADTSAWVRLRRPAVAAVLAPLVEQGVVGTCGVDEDVITAVARLRSSYAIKHRCRQHLVGLAEGLASKVLTEHDVDHKALRQVAHELLHGPCLTQRGRKLRVRRA